jgi:hypothetical protein
MGAGGDERRRERLQRRALRRRVTRTGRKRVAPQRGRVHPPLGFLL